MYLHTNAWTVRVAINNYRAWQRMNHLPMQTAASVAFVLGQSWYVSLNPLSQVLG